MQFAVTDFCVPIQLQCLACGGGEPQMHSSPASKAVNEEFAAKRWAVRGELGQLMGLRCCVSRTRVGTGVVTDFQII